jgi:hypothetical protein
VIDIGLVIDIVVGARVDVLFVSADAAANVVVVLLVVDVVVDIVIGDVVVVVFAKYSIYWKSSFNWWGSKKTVEISTLPTAQQRSPARPGRDRQTQNPAEQSQSFVLISALSHSSLPSRRWRNAGTPFRAARGFVGVLFSSADWIVIPRASNNTINQRLFFASPGKSFSVKPGNL